MIRRAETNLAEHEVLVARFYLKRRVYPAATERLKTVVDRYPRYPEMREVYLDLGRSLLLGNNEAEGKIYLEKLIADWPESEAAAQAKEVLAEGVKAKKEPQKVPEGPTVPATPPVPPAAAQGAGTP
jgi:outer membrane protein assembly factor BamD (BamD/ComL family)